MRRGSASGAKKSALLADRAHYNNCATGCLIDIGDSKGVAAPSGLESIELSSKLFALGNCTSRPHLMVVRDRDTILTCGGCAPSFIFLRTQASGT